MSMEMMIYNELKAIRELLEDMGEYLVPDYDENDVVEDIEDAIDQKEGSQQQKHDHLSDNIEIEPRKGK